MEIKLAEIKDLNNVYELVQNTIKETYIFYYPLEVVDFFCMHHKLSNIENDIKNNNVYILYNDKKIIGTGTIIDNHINRVFVDPKYQNIGYGSFIMTYLENVIADKYNKAVLDSSLAASIFYEKRGYITFAHDSIKVENNKYLVFELMEKNLNKYNSKINYDNKRFIPKMNTENGEVNNNTIFIYHQNNNILWSEYSGGDIIKGNIIGIVLENGELDFYYHHLNINNELRCGKCHSIPIILDNGKLQMKEKWQWLNNDLSEGESLLIEI